MTRGSITYAEAIILSGSVPRLKTTPSRPRLGESKNFPTFLPKKVVP
jgi:hypothetical protein